MAWVLYGRGFSPLVFTEKGAKITSGAREICRTSYEPRLTVSSAWDASHISLQTFQPGSSTSEAISLTFGRWKKIMDSVKGGLLPENEKVKAILEVGDKIILDTTASKRILLTGYHDNTTTTITRTELESDSCVDGLYCMGEDDGIFTHLKNGQVSSATLSSSALKLNRPVLSAPTLVRKVTCASSHVLFLTNTGGKGRVLSLGLNNRGQLGHGDILARPHPSVVEALDGIGIMDVDCGNWHSLAVSEYGDVYSWGWNSDGQLGHSADTATVAIPTLIELQEEMDFKLVRCGSRHSAALSVCGTVYTWGWDGWGQLGHPKAMGPVAMASPGGVVSWLHCEPWTTLYLVYENDA